MREKAREEKGERERSSQEAEKGVPLARPYAVRVGGTVNAGAVFIVSPVNGPAVCPAPYRDGERRTIRCD